MKILCISIYIILLKIIKSLKNDFRSFNLLKLSNVYYVELYMNYIDNSSKTIIVMVDINAEFTLMAIPYLCINKNIMGKFSETKDLLFKDTIVPARVITSTVLISNEVVENYTFYNIDDMNLFHFLRPYIPLAYSFSNETFSITHSLYNKKIIQHKKFSFDPILSQLHIGGVPFDSINGKYSSKCQVRSKYKKWGCTMNYAYIGNLNNYTQIYNNKNRYAYFISTESKIYAPKYFFDFMQNKLLKEQFDNGLCTLNNDTFANFFSCKCELFDKLYKIYFSFDEREFSIPMRSILFKSPFEEKNDKCDLLIYNKANNNDWILGVSFLNNFVTVFDYEDSTIKFYSDYPFYQSEIMHLLTSTHTSIILFIIVITINALNCIILIYTKIKLNN